MDAFDFSKILANAEKAQEYKRNNYYTNYYNHPIDEYDYTKEVIEVEDWEGYKGKMTLGDFSKYIGCHPERVAEQVQGHLKGEGMSKVMLRKFKANFKKINFGEGWL